MASNKNRKHNRYKPRYVSNLLNTGNFPGIQPDLKTYMLVRDGAEFRDCAPMSVFNMHTIAWQQAGSCICKVAQRLIQIAQEGSLPSDGFKWFKKAVLDSFTDKDDM